MLIWSCGLNLRPKSPRGNQNKPIFNSWQVDLILFEPEDQRYAEVKDKVDDELKKVDRVWHYQKLTPAQIELDQLKKAGYDDQRFIVKHLHPFWQGGQGYDDYMQLESLAMTVLPFNTSKLKSDDSLAFAPLIDVAQLVRVINIGSILGGQTFNVDPNRLIPTVTYSNSGETRFAFDDCIVRKNVRVRQKLGGICGLQPVGYPEPEETFGRSSMIYEFSTPEQKERELLTEQENRLTAIKTGNAYGAESLTQLKGPLGKPSIEKLEPLNWTYDGSYRQDQHNSMKYFLTDVNSNLSSRFETEYLITDRRMNDYYQSPLAESDFDFGSVDLSNTYYTIKDKKTHQTVDHFIEDSSGKLKRISSYDEIAFTSQDYALTAFLNKTKEYVHELKGC